ncbi:hypothetical protein RAA17_07545 [Komagataeibacter rhaeticus]|nr:hypothetical protein [Komagataeibacter rhaeticus]
MPCAPWGFFSLGAFPPAPVQQAIHKDIPFAPPAPPAAAALPALPGAPAPLPVTRLRLCTRGARRRAGGRD